MNNLHYYNFKSPVLICNYCNYSIVTLLIYSCLSKKKVYIAQSSVPGRRGAYAMVICLLHPSANIPKYFFSAVKPTRNSVHLLNFLRRKSKAKETRFAAELNALYYRLKYQFI